MVSLALYQPDIAANTGALLRLSACWGVRLEIIHPCGFVWQDEKLRRAGMDYRDLASVMHHASWQVFQETLSGRRLLLLTTRGSVLHTMVPYMPDDVLLLGQESAGVPDAVHQAAAVRVRVPMAAPARSLNVAMAGAVVLAEALRQTDGFPVDDGMLPVMRGTS